MVVFAVREALVDEKNCDHLASLTLKNVPNPITPCKRCGYHKDKWLCLHCKAVHCSACMHTYTHYSRTEHYLFLSYRDLFVRCYRCKSTKSPRVYSVSVILVQEGCNFSLTPQFRDNGDVASTEKPPTKISPESLWEGHLVNSSCVELLSEIKKAHSKTFEHLSFHVPALYTCALNTLGEFYTLFASKCVAEMTIEEITHFGDMLSDLELLRFNVGWLRERLDLIKEMRFGSPLIDEYEESLRNIKAKEKELEELKLLCDSKAVLVKEKFGVLRENVSTRSAADGLLAESTNTNSK